MKLIFLCILVGFGYYIYLYFNPKQEPAQTPSEATVHPQHESHAYASQQLELAKNMINKNLHDEAWQILLHAGRNIHLDESELQPSQIREGRKLRIDIMTEMVRILESQHRTAQARDSEQKRMIGEQQNRLRNLQSEIDLERRRVQNSRIDIRRNQRLNELRSQEHALSGRLSAMERVNQHETVAEIERISNQINTIKRQIAHELTL